MSNKVFDKLQDVGMDDKVKITLDRDNATANGVKFSSPIVTTVKIASDSTLDHKDGHDVDGIVNVREIHLEPISGDNEHDEYVIETRSPMVGDKTVSPVTARDWYQGRVGDGKYTPTGIAGIDDIEVI